MCEKEIERDSAREGGRERPEEHLSIKHSSENRHLEKDRTSYESVIKCNLCVPAAPATGPVPVRPPRDHWEIGGRAVSPSLSSTTVLPLSVVLSAVFAT